MGNRSSKTRDNTRGSQINEQQQLDEASSQVTAVTSSGVFLSNELQAEIVQSFQSEALKTQWEKLQAKILLNHKDRITQDEVRKAQVQEEIRQWRKHNDAVHEALDRKLDELRAKFSDSQVAVSYDVGKLEEKLGKVPKFGGKDTACLDVRMALVNCLKDVTDVRECDGVLQVVERCVKQTVIAHE